MTMAADMTGEGAMVESPGKAIAAARKAQDISYDTIHEKTLIPVWKLKALENEQYKQLGSRPFAVGYIRQVAKLLGLDDENLVRNFNQIIDPDNKNAVHSVQPVQESVKKVGSKRDYRSLWSPWTLLVLVAVWSASVWFFQGDNVDNDTVEQLQAPQEEEDLPLDFNVDSAEVDALDSREEPLENDNNDANNDISTDATQAPISGDQSNTPAPSGTSVGESQTLSLEVLPTAPSTENSPPRAAPATGSDTISMVFNDECWVEIRDVNGTRIVARLYNKGDNLQRSGEGPFSVLLGNARAAEVMMNGEQVSVNPRGNQKTLRMLVSAPSSN